MRYKRKELKDLLLKHTGCDIQHTGWPCGTCFFAISEKLDNRDWQTVLFTRGDYAEADLDNLPKSDKSIEKRIDRIIKIICTLNN